MVSRSLVFLAIREMLSTITVSPARTKPIIALKSFSVNILTACLIDEDLLDFLFLHHLPLPGLVLLGSGAADIAYSHGTTPLS